MVFKMNICATCDAVFEYIPNKRFCEECSRLRILLRDRNRSRKVRKDNPKQMREYRRSYYNKNKVRINAYKRQWLKDNPEKRREYQARWIRGKTKDKEND